MTTDDVTDQVRQALATTFGFDRFLKGQEQVIQHLLAGRSAAAIFPTGGGKSLCYQLPALLLPGLTLVVSPLIALMKDQIDALTARGVAAARLDSSLDIDGYRDVMQSLRDGTLRLLYVAPERFNNERFRQAMATVDVAIFAVDEAHCISEWGHNFRPDYLKLAELAKGCGARAMFGLTATATPAVVRDICRVFDIAPECVVRTGFYRPNLTLCTTATEASARDALLVDRLRTRPPGPTIVYVTLQRTADSVAGSLRSAGFDARPYHAGKKDEVRTEVQDWFLTSDRGVVVATIAFGMGIDKPDIRYVYHYNLPKSLENLSQEIGRAGRDGQPSTCEILVYPGDRHTLENFAYGDTPSLRAVRGLLDELIDAGDHLELNYHALSTRHDIRILVLRTLLTYLELDGYLRAGTPFYDTYKFKPLATSKEILQRFDGDRREFLARLFAQAKKARTWFGLDLARATAALDTSRDRIVAALDHLAEQKLIELEVAGVRHRFEWQKPVTDAATLASTLHDRTLARERNEIARLDQVLALMCHDGCQVSHLGAHFGEPLDGPCGHCSFCLNDHAVVLPRYEAASIDDEMWRRACALREKQDCLTDPRTFVRFVAGLPSPRITRGRLARHELFGALATVPFPTLLARVREA